METLAKIVLFITFTGLLVAPAPSEAKTMTRYTHRRTAVIRYQHRVIKVRAESFIPDNANGGASTR